MLLFLRRSKCDVIEIRILCDTVILIAVTEMAGAQLSSGNGLRQPAIRRWANTQTNGRSSKRILAVGEAKQQWLTCPSDADWRYH